MPNAAFIITLNLDNISPDALADLAIDIGDSLVGDGFDVVDAKAWERPSLGGLPQAPEQTFGTGVQLQPQRTPWLGDGPIQ